MGDVMRIFVSYARVDKPYCIQIVDTLDVHETWYDQRLYAGQNWWKEILRRLDWSEAFIYLLSPDSVSSEYCRKEYDLAKSLGKHIVPVLIREDTQLPEYLRSVQYVDLTKGITPDAVKTLLNSVYLAERQKQSALTVTAISSDKISPPVINPVNVISLAASAMENAQFDQAVFLLRQAKENGFASRFINIDALLLEAETALERLSYYREAEREYKQISELVRHTRTRKLGLEAFRAFRKDFPDYDPDHLTNLTVENAPQISILTPPSPSYASARLAPSTLPLLDWCDIPAGTVLVDEIDNEHHISQRQFPVNGFKISKYPITNNQFTIFRDDPNGYSNTKWWEFSPEAYNWRVNNPEPKPARFKGEERPREMVNWYDAVAFCNWLGSYTGIPVSLPTALEWQRAARGDDTRVYPWGNAFDKSRCNTRESDIKMTSLVMRYNNGASPFDVYDMAGNVWEWCLNLKPKTEIVTLPTPRRNPTDLSLAGERAVFGGSFVSAYQRSQIAFHYYLDPLCYHATIGFRVVQKSL
jgi:formylglycine-generating enzyme required for sulfatase activity